MSNDVAIVMGSDSDWPTMEPAAKVLEQCGITYIKDVVSAHRTPEEMLEFAKSAASKGLKVIIAGAGGAAHLPGMLASATHLPVIGVPVPLKHLEGMDSLHSSGYCWNWKCKECRTFSSSNYWNRKRASGGKSKSANARGKIRITRKREEP